MLILLVAVANMEKDMGASKENSISPMKVVFFFSQYSPSNRCGGG